MRRTTALAIATAAALAIPSAPAADPGVTADSILLGQVAALKGPAKALGGGMQAGLEAAFAAANAAGGIDGRTIELRSINDGYEPDKAAMAATMLIDKANVFALIGGVGTPTAKAIVPLCQEKQVPFIAPFTGAGFLRDVAANDQVVNFRASYDQEMERLAAYLVDELGLERIACFYQNDGYGQVGLAGITRALESRGMTLAATGTYERNTVAIAGGLESVKAGQPQAVVMVGAYTGCAAFIKAAKADAAFANTKFCNISFVGTRALGQALGADADGVIVSQCVPFPWDTSIPVVAEYHTAMKSAGKESEIGFVSLEGYLAGRVFLKALDACDGNLTRANLLAAFRGLGSFDLGGVPQSFGEGDNQGCDDVFLTAFDGTQIRPMSTAAIANVPTD
jgi:ABC-type branched-subunit amino acid transport system substrate-binding protein